MKRTAVLLLLPRLPALLFALAAAAGAQAMTIRELRTLEANLPTILMGDLNEPDLKSGVLRAFEQRHRIAACGPSFHARMPVFSLDRIIVTEDIEIAATGVHVSALSREASDHLPIWARLSLPPANS